MAHNIFGIKKENSLTYRSTKGTKYLNFNKTKNEVSQFFYVASTLSRVDQ